MIQDKQRKRAITILGSTGSIGTQALDIIARHPDLFEVYALVANRSSELLISQAKAFSPAVVVISDDSYYLEVKEALKDLPIHVWAGMDSVISVAASQEADIVLIAMVGFAGLEPTISAIKAGRTIALANKETLVVAGEMITSLARKHKAPIIPVDSEHSAIFQCLIGENENKISKLILTASGGPFVDIPASELRDVTPERALKHPNWKMGNKVTIDSSTLMNKGFEMIEAHWLFDVSPSDIDVFIHRQSIVHSMVAFEDGSIKAQLGLPDMRVPIAYALSFPYRKPTGIELPSIHSMSNLSFEPPRIEDFPNLSLAYRSIETGGVAPCILNAANEIAVERFLSHEIGFTKIPQLIEAMLDKYSSSCASPSSLEDLISLNREVRQDASLW
ncbi:MAG: 1-deoxy-D-xylulose-5-phosphate reductoisomerase [Porphyromonas sp.]|nr:1-deoxy-D-xylulose-5-phosphate reductoisomerase [Porphyromonas sp.]